MEKLFRTQKCLILLVLCDLSADVTQIMNLKAEKFDIFTFTNKHVDRKQNPPEIILSTPKRIFCVKFHALLPLGAKSGR